MNFRDHTTFTPSTLEQYEALVLEHLSDTSLDYGICKLSQGIIDMMEGKPEPAESIIGNAVGTIKQSGF